MTHPFPTRRSAVLRRAACRLVIAVGRDMENAVRLVPHRLRQRGGRQDYHRDRGHRSPHRHSSLPRFSAPMELRRALFGEGGAAFLRSEEHTSELQSLMRISYAVFCFKKKNN